MTDFVTVEGRALAKAMKIINSVIERRNTIPILGCVKLTYSGEGLRIDGTDLDLEISLSVDEIEGEGEWALCIDADRLAAIAYAAGVAPLRIERTTRDVPTTNAKGMPSGTRTDTAASIIVGDGDAVYNIDYTYPDSDWPELNKTRGDLIERFTNGMFAAVIEKVSWAVSTEETRYYLNGVCWQTSGNGKRFAATDGHRLALCRYGGDGGDTTSRIIPRKTVAFVVANFQASDVAIFTTNDPLVIDIVSPAMTLRTKLIDGTFPDIDRVVPKREDVVHTLDLKREEIITAIRQATAVGGGGKNSASGPAIRFTDDNGKLHIERKNADFGSSKVKTSTTWREGLEAFGFNSRYMLDVISRCQGAISFGIQSKAAPFLVGDDDDTMTRVIMPMRV